MRQFNVLHVLLNVVLIVSLASCAPRQGPTIDVPEAIVTPVDRSTFVVQLPRGKTIEEVIRAAGCGVAYICTIGFAGEIYIVKRKETVK